MDAEKDSSTVFDNFLFPKIFQTFRIAIQPTKLIIAFLALAIICLAGQIMDFSKTVVAAGNENTELQVYVTNPDRVQQFIEENKQTGEHRGVFSTLWHFNSARFHDTINSLLVLNIPGVKANITECLKAIGWALQYHYIYCIIFFVIKLAVLSVAGGSLCRITALQFARGEKPGLIEAVRFSTKKFASFFTAPLAPAGIIILIGLSVFLLGLIGNIPRIGELTMGIFTLLALLAGALIAVVLIGTIAGFSLMFPAVAYDGSDCFDAISRSFSYIYSRPWRMGFYTAVAAVYGAICYMFVRFFTFLLLWVTHRLLQLGVWVDNSSKEVDKLTAVWPEPTFTNLLGSSVLTEANWSELTTAVLVQLSLLVVVGLLVAFVISFYFSANTIIYSLMRNRVDNTALEDVHIPFDDSKTDSTITESEPNESQSQPETETDDA